MAEYQDSITVNATPDVVFRIISDVRNFSQYMPTTHHAELQGVESVRVQGEAAGHSYDSDGYFRVDVSANYMEWGSDEEPQYKGWMDITPLPGGRSKVTVHLSFAGSKKMKHSKQDLGGNHDPAIQEGLNTALSSIKALVEGTGGKVEPPAAT